MKKILVPTDFSTCADAAVNAALRLAKKASAQLFFLHLYPDMEAHSHVSRIENELTHKHHQNVQVGTVKDAMEKILRKCESLGVPATPILIPDTGQEMEDYIDAYEIDFVVMGSHGVNGIKETILGSNTQRFIRRCPVPVLVIKNEQTDFSVSKIVFVSSFEEDSVKAFSAVQEMAVLWNAEVFLLFVNTPYHFKETHESTVDMRRFMHQFPRVAYTPVIYDALDEERGVKAFSVENKIDLIALSTHGTKGLYRLLSHGVAEGIINHQTKPVLVINIREKPEHKKVLTTHAAIS
jgi:nucleotide-binding universal stress UspA family protein